MGANVNVETLLQALRAVYGAETAPTVRVEAHNALDSFKATASTAVLLSATQTLLNVSEGSDEVSHFAFHLVEDVILKHRWRALSVEEQLSVRDFALSAVAVSRTAVSSRKIAALLSALAQRMWPQTWPNFIEQIMTIQGPMPLEILTALSEDVFEFNAHIEKRRRQELAKCLTTALEPLILPFLTRYVESASTGQLVVELKAGLQAFKAISTWAPMRPLFNVSVPQSLLMLLASCAERKPLLPICNLLAECLEVMVERKDPTSKGCEKEWGALSPSFLQVAELLMNLGGPSSELYEAEKQLLHILVVFATNHVVRSAENRKVFTPFLQLLAGRIAVHPSWLVTNLTVPFWNSWFRNDLCRDSDYRPFCVTWLQLSWLRVMRFGDPDKNDHPSCACSRTDFDSAAAFRLQLVQTRGKILSLFKLAAKICCKEGVDFGLRRLGEAIAALESSVSIENQIFNDIIIQEGNGWRITPTVGVRAKGIVKEVSYATVSGIQALLPEIQLESQMKTDLLPLMNQILSQLFAVGPMASDELLVLKAQALRIPKLVYDDEQNVLRNAFSELFRLVVHKRDTSEDLATLDGEAKEIRSTACSSVTYLTGTPHDRSFNASLSDVRTETLDKQAIIPLITPLTQHIATLLKSTATSQPNLLVSEQLALCEALSLISNSIDDVEAQARFLEEVLTGPVSVLTATHWKEALQGPQQFLDYFRLTKKDGVDLVVERSREDILNVLAVFDVVTRHVKKLDQSVHPLLKSIFPSSWPTLLGFLRCVGSLSHPEGRQLLEQADSQDILKPSTRELVHLMNLDGVDLGSTSDFESVLAQLGYTTPTQSVPAQDFVKRLRSHSVDIVSRALRSGFHEDPSVLEQILMLASLNIFDDWNAHNVVHKLLCPVLDNRTLRSVQCPVEQCIAAIQSVLSLLYRRLSLGFGKGISATDESDVLEIAEDQALRLLDRSCTDLLLALAPQIAQEKDREEVGEDERMTSATPVLSQCGRVLYGNAGTAVWLVRLGLGCFHWPDAKSSRAAATLFLRMLPDFLSSALLTEFIVKELLPDCFTLMTLPHLSDSDAVAMSIILEIFSKLPSQSSSTLIELLPTVPAERISSLVRACSTGPLRKSDARALLKSFLNDTLGIFPGSREAERKVTSVWTPSPGALKINTRGRPGREMRHEAADEPGLDEFFDKDHSSV